MDLIKISFETLFDKECSYKTVLSYSGRFSDFNANGRVNKWNNTIEINVSKKWKPVSDEIKIGLIQSLLLKLFREKQTSINIDLYHAFLKQLDRVVSKHAAEPLLVERFHLLNEKYFSGLMEQPNLVFGAYSKTKLGSYNYKTDTITISRVFERAPEFIDLVLYHELLHKKHKFTASDSGRCHHHTPAFRREERAYEQFAEREEDMKRFLRTYKAKTFLSRLFS